MLSVLAFMAPWALYGAQSASAVPADDAPPVAPIAVAAAPVAPAISGTEVSSTVLFAALSDDEVLSRAAEAVEAIDTLRAAFVQTAPSGSVSAGTISMDRPGRLRFDYDAPSAQEIVATGGLVYVHDSDLETTDSYPIGTTPLRFLLADRIDADGVRLTGVERMDGEVAVSLQAADSDLSGEVALVFSGTEDALTLDRWAVVDPQGGITLVQLSDIETGVKLSRRLFRIPEAGGLGLGDRRR